MHKAQWECGHVIVEDMVDTNADGIVLALGRTNLKLVGPAELPADSSNLCVNRLPLYQISSRMLPPFEREEVTNMHL